jgi:hypothetical protein
MRGSGVEAAPVSGECDWQLVQAICQQENETVPFDAILAWRGRVAVPFKDVLDFGTSASVKAAWQSALLGPLTSERCEPVDGIARINVPVGLLDRRRCSIVHEAHEGPIRRCKPARHLRIRRAVSLRRVSNTVGCCVITR